MPGEERSSLGLTMAGGRHFFPTLLWRRVFGRTRSEGVCLSDAVVIIFPDSALAGCLATTFGEVRETWRPGARGWTTGGLALFFGLAEAASTSGFIPPKSPRIKSPARRSPHRYERNVITPSTHFFSYLSSVPAP